MIVASSLKLMTIQKNYFCKENTVKIDYKVEIHNKEVNHNIEQNLQKQLKKFTAKRMKKNLEVDTINSLNGIKKEMIKNLVNLCSNKRN